MNKKAQQSELRRAKLLTQQKYIKVLVLSIGLFSTLFSCNQNSKIKERETLVQRFFEDNLKNNHGKRIFVAIISSDCQDCINTDINLIKKWKQEKHPITFIMDPKMLNEVSMQVKNIYQQSVIVDNSTFVRYGITEGRMLVMYANNKDLEMMDLIPDGTQTYTFRQ